MTGKQARRRQLLRTIGLRFSGMDVLKALGLYLVAVMCCLLLRSFDMHNDTSYVAMIFLLDVFLTAYWTDGYLLGIIMAVVGMFSVDIIFTYPFWHISFTLTGFPLTFLVMMTISILTATVTSRAKQTEQVRREADREKMYADLLRAVSHDIRTPLTGIVGATNVLLEQDGGLTQEQRQQLLRSTNEDAQWLIRIVENLLSITRISSEEAKVKKEPEPAEEVIESAVAKTHKHYPEVDIRVHLPAELMMVPMDPLLMEQVLVNLMENAVKYNRPGGSVRVELAQGQEKCIIRVSDTGCGIPEEYQRSIFHPFFRVDKSRSREYGGAGLGLSLVWEIADLHGGSVWVEKSSDKGTTIAVGLPTQQSTKP